MILKKNIREYANDFFNLMFPRVCINCRTILVYQEEHLCTACRLSIPKTGFHLKKDNPLFQKFVSEPKVKEVATYMHFNKFGIAQKIIHELKYNNRPEIGIMMGRWYAQELKEAKWNFDMIISVPLHPSKLKKRGYNQSDQIALGISEVLGIPVEKDIASRIRKTTTQTKKSKVQRWQNLDSVYQINKPEQIEGKNLLIVDDVLTTGATIGQLVSEISKFPVNNIFIATIAAGQ